MLAKKVVLWNKAYSEKEVVVTTVITATTVTIITNATSVITVTTVTTTIVKFQMLLLYSNKGKFFTKASGPTDRLTDRPTTRVLELLWAAKNTIKTEKGVTC